MPTRKLRPTKTEDHEFRISLSRLESLGVAIGDEVDIMPAPSRLSLELIDDGVSRLYELPSGAIAVVINAKMVVLKSSLLITNRRMLIPWDDCPLDLLDPDGLPSYTDLIGQSLNLPSTFLYPWLTHKIPLRPRQEEGVIIAHGWSPVPPEYHDNTDLTVELILEDQHCNELRFSFKVPLDRSIIRKYERLVRERPKFVRSERSGLFGPNIPQPEDHKRVAHSKTPTPPTSVNRDSIGMDGIPGALGPTVARRTEKRV